VKKSVEELLEEQLEMLCESNETITKFAAKNEICDSLVQVHDTVNDSIVGISELLIGKRGSKKTKNVNAELEIRTPAQKDKLNSQLINYLENELKSQLSKLEEVDNRLSDQRKKMNISQIIERGNFIPDEDLEKAGIALEQIILRTTNHDIIINV